MQDELYELKLYFSVDDEEIENYLSKLFITIELNYDNGEYQFAYFALHLVFMTYIYNLVWQISKLSEKTYQLASLFARPFNGCEIDLNNVKSIFEYKDLPEKEIVNYLYLIDFDSSYIGTLKKQIEKRNSMAHASGTYDLIDINSFDPEKDTIVSIIKECTAMFNNKLLKKFYVKSIMEWQSNETMNHSDFEEFIDKYLIIDISASPMELKFLADLSRNQFYKIMKELEYNDNIYINLFKKHLEIAKKIKKLYLINYFDN